MKDEQMSDYANPDALVSTDWLAEHLDDPSVRVVEVDEDTSLYEASHIPGAILWDWNADLHDGVRRDYLDRGRLRDLLGRSGVGPDTTVVLYGGNNSWFASYAYWLLKYRGFDRVRLLNGGRKKWELEERPTNAEVPRVETVEARLDAEERPELRALRDHVLDAAGKATFIDVRSPQEFSGEKLAPEHLPQEQPYVGGHVPGAKNIPWSKAANEDGTFKSAGELREIYEAAGVGSGPETIAYCRIGERSSHTWFVLNELLGHENVRNYDGSWTEYGSLVGVPVERGAGA
jgi:thiosulfate/3-mercaptopyruvate sulfurtransferase